MEEGITGINVREEGIAKTLRSERERERKSEVWHLSLS